MTLTTLLKSTGKFYPWRDASRIGHLIATLAREKNVRWTKVPEMVTVNDYPEEFIGEMEGVIASYFEKKNEVTKRVIAEMRADEKQIPVEEKPKQPRKRVPIKPIEAHSKSKIKP